MLKLVRPLYPAFFSLFKENPEAAHHRLMSILHQIDQVGDGFWSSWSQEQLAANFCFTDQSLSQNLWGLTFSNPMGLAAGFDKDGLAAGLWQYFGFGFTELGAVTLHPQPGNPKPRLFRLPADKAILNRLGANNQGAVVLAQRLTQTHSEIPIGINLCKSKITPLEEAHLDYLASFKLLKPWADYFVVNVSSPNTPGLRSLQGGEQLSVILDTLQTENQNTKPILVKIAPDLDWQEIKAIIDLAQSYQLAGIVATNTTIRRDGLKTTVLQATGKPLTEEAGGISGAPLQARSTEVIRFIYRETQGKLPIIGVGGIFTAEDAWQKIQAGASLLQLYTGWLYQGPWLIKEILTGLKTKLNLHGFNHLEEAIGQENSRNMR